jgi:hypothetical protein
LEAIKTPRSTLLLALYYSQTAWNLLYEMPFQTVEMVQESGVINNLHQTDLNFSAVKTLCL